MENTGFEVDFRSVNIQKDKFNWTTTFNLSIPKNKLVKFQGLEESTFANKLVVGEPISIVKLYHTIGVDPEIGLYQFEDYNNDGTISRPDDRQWIEDTAPKFYGGLGNIINYGNWQLDFFFQFKKQKALNYLGIEIAPGQPNNQPVAVLDRWQEPGDTGPIQRYGLGFYPGELDSFVQYARSDAAFTDASFIRLRNVSLTYTLPKPMTKGMDCNIYLQGQNLLTFTKYDGPDPDQLQVDYLPLLRQFTLGLQLGF